MLSSTLASPSLVIGSGSTVVTWDCRHEEPSPSDEGLKSFNPFPAGASNNISPPNIADLAWNHNGQGEIVFACLSFEYYEEF